MKRSGIHLGDHPIRDDFSVVDLISFRVVSTENGDDTWLIDSLGNVFLGERLFRSGFGLNRVCYLGHVDVDFLIVLSGQLGCFSSDCRDDCEFKDTRTKLCK